MADPAAPDDRVPQAALDEPWDEAFDGALDRSVPEPPPVAPPQVVLSVFQQQARCVVGPCRYYFEVAGPRWSQPPGVARYCMLSRQKLPGDQDADGLPVPTRCETWDPMVESEYEARDVRRSVAVREEQIFKKTEEKAP